MTKHLRLIMLSLLAMICLGGYSQSETVFKTLSFPDNNQANNKVGAYDKNWTARIGTDTWTISNFNNNNWDTWTSIKCGRNGFSSTASIATDNDLGAAITKVVVHYGKVGNANNITACYLQVASDANFKNIIERKSTTKLTTKTKETAFIVTEPAVGRYFKVVYELTKASKNGFVEIKNVEYFTKSDKADSKIKFNEAAKEVDLKTEMLRLSDLITNPHNLPITYSTSDKETAEEVDGTLLLYKTGKVTVTASFAGDDTYAATSTSMELTIVDNRLDAGIHFAKDSYTADIAKGTFNGAELVKPEGINKIIYTISPESEGVSIAEDGTVTYPAVEATYTVTAKFAGNDTYKPATATYTLNVVDNRQDAGIHFANDSYTADITGRTFNEAVLVKPEGINKVIYTISPESEGVSIAKDGTVTYPAVEATYKVTATFNGNDTYKPATATYTLNVVDPNFETRTAEFVAGVDKTTQMTPGDDSMSKGIITISSDRAAFGYDANYRFYKGADGKNGETTISTKYGTITKIEFVHADKPLSNLSTQVGEYKYDETTKDAVWTGNSKSVLFTAKDQARASKITVSVKVPVAKDYTLDENSVNTIEAYENANVTLKRTFYKDGEWNTLCLPFAVANAKTAFDGAELREVDTQNRHDNTIVFKEATTIEAGKPYLIKWAKTPNEVCDFVNTFEGVTLVATATPVKVNDAITFTGFYNKATADKLGASVAAIGAGNKLFKVTSGEMKGFRAAFVLNPATPAAGIKVVIDGTTTGIEDLVVDGVKANGRVYNLNGQYVGNSLNGLQPGIYIQNGKKVVVK